MSKDLLERILTEAVLPFWLTRAPDGEFGGYRLHHDVNGAWKGPAGKALVTQARTLWFFSRLMRSKYARPEYLDLAKTGFAFLSEKLRDTENSGFYWETSYDGAIAGKPAKHLYGQSFALYALAEYAAVSRDGSANDMARELFRLIDARAHDSQFGGYIECFSRDWSTPDERNAYLPVTPPRKSLNTHLHLLEAFTRYYQLTTDEFARRRIVELLQILSSAVVRKRVGACTNAHERDWTPVGPAKQWRISYGHDVELGWLIADACETVDVPKAMFLDLYRSFADYALAFGFDRRHGGFYHTGLANRNADDRRKIWWVQAEAMLGMLKLHRITGHSKYYEGFEKTLDWVAKRQTDWRNGDWFAEIDRFGRPGGDKSGPWKAPYHNGRALLECIELLERTSATG